MLTKEEREQKIRELAYKWYEIRMKYGIKDTPENDWLKAETIVEADGRNRIKHYFE